MVVNGLALRCEELASFPFLKAFNMKDEIAWYFYGKTLDG